MDESLFCVVDESLFWFNSKITVTEERSVRLAFFSPPKPHTLVRKKTDENLQGTNFPDFNDAHLKANDSISNY